MDEMRLRRQQVTHALVWVGLAAVVSGCGPSTETNQAANASAPAEEPATNLAAKVPLPAAVMDRAALLQAVSQARSAAAVGADDRDAQRQLDGKQFEVRIRFGCRGPAPSPDDASLGWTFDAKKRVLRIRATPTVDAADPAIASATPDNIEAVEGFWIPRPWVLLPVCPAPAPQPQPAAEGQSSPPKKDAKPQPSPEPRGQASIEVLPRVAIAQFFTAEDARTRRRDHRPYEAVKTIEEGAEVGSGGFNLVLSGRLRAIGDGRVIRCNAAAPDRPPDCVISSRVDRVRFEQPTSGEVLAEWSGS